MEHRTQNILKDTRSACVTSQRAEGARTREPLDFGRAEYGIQYIDRSPVLRRVSHRACVLAAVAHRVKSSRQLADLFVAANAIMARGDPSLKEAFFKELSTDIRANEIVGRFQAVAGRWRRECIPRSSEAWVNGCELFPCIERPG